MSLAHFAPDPGYGRGSYRRNVRLRLNGDAVVATIDDTHHSMWLLLKHRQGSIVWVEAGIERGPATSCGGAPAMLRAVEGLPLAAPASAITARLPPSTNCTHLADLLRWAIRAALHRIERTDYAIVVPDQDGGPVWIEVRRNGVVVHRWLVDGETILAPTPLAGRPLLKGFLAWAREAFDEDELEAAMMLQRGVWVARGRRYVVDRTIVPLRLADGMKDACHSYSGENWAIATNTIGYVRDFSERVQRSPLPAHIREFLGEDQHAAE